MSTQTTRTGVSIYRSDAYYRLQQKRRRRWTLVAVAVVVLLVAAGVAAVVVRGRGGGAPDSAASGGSGAKTAAATPTAVASSTPSASPSPSPSAPTVIEIGWVGDTTPGSMYGDPPDNGRALFAHVRDELKAPDLMMPTSRARTRPAAPPSAPAPTPTSASPSRRRPRSRAPCRGPASTSSTMANNHANDYFGSGLEQTQAALKKNDVEYTGMPAQITTVNVKGVKVAVARVLAVPVERQHQRHPGGARTSSSKAAAKADVVVVLMHVGAEGSDKTHTPHGSEFAFGENRGDPRAFAHAVVDAGADLVLGSGPHVIRGIERYRTRLIAYSLGNFGGWGNFGTGGHLEPLRPAHRQDRLRRAHPQRPLALPAARRAGRAVGRLRTRPTSSTSSPPRTSQTPSRWTRRATSASNSPPQTGFTVCGRVRY